MINSKNKEQYCNIPLDAVNKLGGTENGMEILHAWIFQRITGFSNAGKECYISNEQFAEETGRSVSSVKRAITKLEQDGYIVKKTVHMNGAQKRRYLYLGEGHSESCQGSHGASPRFTVDSCEGHGEPCEGHGEPRTRFTVTPVRGSQWPISNTSNNTLSNTLSNTDNNINNNTESNTGSITNEILNDNISSNINNNPNNNTIIYTKDKYALDDWKSDLERLQKERDEKEAAFWAEFDKPWSDDMRDHWEEDLERIKQERAKASAVLEEDVWASRDGDEQEEMDDDNINTPVEIFSFGR